MKKKKKERKKLSFFTKLWNFLFSIEIQTTINRGVGLNPLTGPIPTEFGNLINLKEL